MKREISKSRATRNTRNAQQMIDQILNDYFENLNGYPARNLHKIIIGHVERRLIQQTLERANKNQTEAATMLGISRGTLRTKLNQYKKTEKMAEK